MRSIDREENYFDYMEKTVDFSNQTNKENCGAKGKFGAFV